MLFSPFRLTCPARAYAAPTFQPADSSTDSAGVPRLRRAACLHSVYTVTDERRSHATIDEFLVAQNQRALV